MKKIPISRFKAECLQMLEHLGPEGIEITKHGKPLAKVFPVAQQSASLIGCMKGKIKKKGNVFSTGVTWDAES